MACRCAACSIAPLLGNRNRNTSVRITIHSFVFTAGSQTCACWRSRKLNRFRALRFHIRSSSVSSEQSGGSTLIGYFFGTPRTWRASCTITKCITTRIESIVRSAARPPRYAPAYPQLFQPRLTVTRGGHIAAVCFRLRSPPDLYFVTHRGKIGPPGMKLDGPTLSVDSWSLIAYRFSKAFAKYSKTCSSEKLSLEVSSTPKSRSCCFFGPSV